MSEIPSHKTPEELAALRASDPAAFDDDEIAGSEADKEAAAKAEQEAAEKAEADRIAAEEAARAEAAKKDEKPIDKRQYDGVLGDLRDTRSALAQERAAREALAAEIAALKAGPAIDYDAEITALDETWNDDKFDGDHAAYLAKRDGLLVGKAKADARADFQREQEQAAAERAALSWANAANAFVEAHPEYRDADAKTDLEAALHGVFAKFPDASDADKLERAHKIVLAMNGKTEAAPEPKGPNADRDKADAQAASTASAQPPVIKGGVGNRAAAGNEVDMANLKPGSFSKLSKDQQAAALGGADAL